jgi:hypothetical protein
MILHTHLQKKKTKQKINGWINVQKLVLLAMRTKGKSISFRKILNSTIFKHSCQLYF